GHSSHNIPQRSCVSYLTRVHDQVRQLFLRLALRLFQGLRIAVHRRPERGMAEEFLHLLDIVPIPTSDPWLFFAEVGSRSERRRAWSRDPRRQEYKDNPSPRGFAD